MLRAAGWASPVVRKEGKCELKLGRRSAPPPSHAHMCPKLTWVAPQQPAPTLVTPLMNSIMALMPVLKRISSISAVTCVKV